MDAQMYKYPLQRSTQRGTRRVSDASYRYRWNDLDFRTFLSIGVIARRSPDGAACFNFPQTVWLFPDVAMDWSRRPNRSVQTLAVNILMPFVRRCCVEIPHDPGNVKRYALGLARPFAETFLLTMPTTGGRIPREVIVEWLQDAL